MSNKNKFYSFIEMLYKKYFLHVSLAMDISIQGGNELRTVFIENNETGWVDNAEFRTFPSDITSKLSKWKKEEMNAINKLHSKTKKKWHSIKEAKVYSHFVGFWKNGVNILEKTTSCYLDIWSKFNWYLPLLTYRPRHHLMM